MLRIPWNKPGLTPVAGHLSCSRVSSWDPLILRCDGTQGYLSKRISEIDNHLEMRRGKWGSSWVVAGPSVFLLSGDDYVGEHLEWHQWCQGSFRGWRGKVGFLLRCRSRKGPHLTLRGESLEFSRVAVGNLAYLSSCHWNLRNPLMWPQEIPVSIWVARGFSGFLSCQCRVLGPHLELQPQP